MSIDEVRGLVRRGGMLRNEEAYVLLDALDAVTRERDRLRGDLSDALDELTLMKGAVRVRDELIASLPRPFQGGGDGR